MHQKRQAITTKLPIPRKGSAYIARASSHIQESVPVVVALRDMLNLAKTAREVRNMIKARQLQLNGREVRDYRESIRLFNILKADKSYILSILPTGKFFLEETKSTDSRTVKVTGKRQVSKGVYQLNFHDGTNIQTKSEVSVGDSLIIDFSGKIKDHHKLDKGAKVFVLSGKYQGHTGTISEAHEGHAHVNFKEGKALLEKSHLIVQ